MGLNAGRIDAIGIDDKSSGSYTTKIKKKNQWENIGEMLNGAVSYLGNIPQNFNSAFTVGVEKGGEKSEGAFRA